MSKKPDTTGSIAPTVGAPLADDDAGTVCLYHGSVVESVKDMMESGVSYDKAKEFGKEGDREGSFYTTIHRDVANTFAFAKSEFEMRGKAAVLKFDLPRQVIKDLASQSQVIENVTGGVYQFLPPSYEKINATMT